MYYATAQPVDTVDTGPILTGREVRIIPEAQYITSVLTLSQNTQKTRPKLYIYIGTLYCI